MALMPASKICGAAVENPAGDALGSITELMVEADTGRVGYAVLAHGGVLGVGERLFAVPWRAFRAHAQEGKLVLDADKARLDAAAGIDKDAWPAAAPDDWLR